MGADDGSTPVVCVREVRFRAAFILTLTVDGIIILFLLYIFGLFVAVSPLQ